MAKNKEERRKKSLVLFYVYTFILFGLAIMIAITVESIEEIFNLVGAIASNSIGFLFPSAFYLFSVLKKKKARTFGTI